MRAVSAVADSLSEPQTSVGRTVQAPTPTLSSANSSPTASPPRAGISLPRSLRPRSPYYVIPRDPRAREIQEERGEAPGGWLAPARWRRETGGQAAAPLPTGPDGTRSAWPLGAVTTLGGGRAASGLVPPQGLHVVAPAHLGGELRRPSVRPGGTCQEGLRAGTGRLLTLTAAHAARAHSPEGTVPGPPGLWGGVVSGPAAAWEGMGDPAMSSGPGASPAGLPGGCVRHGLAEGKLG